MAPSTNRVPRRLFLPLVIAFWGLACAAFATPAAPSNFSTTYTQLDTSTHVWRFSWQDNSTDEDGFAIRFMYFNGAQWVDQMYGSFAVDAATKASSGTMLSVSGGLSTTAFRYEGVPGNFFYFPLQWYVVSYNNAGSANSNTTSYSTAPGPASPQHGAPGTPEVTAPSVGGDGSLHVTFADGSNMEREFDLQYKKTSDSTWQSTTLDFNMSIVDVGGYQTRTANADMFLPNFIPDTSYDFRVRAVDYGGNATAFSSTTTVTTQSFQSPTGLTATRVGENTFDLTFNNNSNADSGYQFQYRAQGSSTWLDLGMVDNPFFNTINTGALPPNTLYEFQVRAYRRNVNNTTTPPVAFSAFSNSASGTSIFTAPTNLTATSPSEGRVSLAWTDNSTAEGNYEVQVRIKNTTTPNNWTVYDYLAANTTTLANQLIAPGETLEFRVRATYGSQAEVVSGFTNIAEVTAPFIAPTNLVATASATSPYQVSFTWTDNSGVETDYELQYRKNSDTSYTTRKLFPGNAGTAPNNMSYANLPEFEPGTVYHFRIRAVVAGSDGSIISGSAYTADSDTTTLNGFTSKPYAPITMGTPFSYQLATQSQQTRESWSVGTLPAGLTFDNTTGIISGTPSVAGAFSVPLTANFTGGTSHVLNLALRILRPSGAPQIAATIADQVMAPGGSASIALGTKFADPDTDSAVRMTTNKGNLDIVLYSSLTPGTVTNFLSYNYANTIFHRAPTNFVMQGGGYTAYEAPNVFESLPRQATITNEPGISNTYGTVAMAKLGDDPNSATSEFFFSLGNNSLNLDNQNGGFTVFGRLSAPSSNVISAMAATPTSSYAVKLRQGGVTPSAANFSFSNIPIDQTPVPTAIDTSKLLKVLSVTPLPVLSYAITTAPDSAIATVALNGADLQITAVAPGTTSVVITATDVDANIAQQTVSIVVSKSPATVTLDTGNLAQVYNGTPRVVTATTVPAGLGVTFTYDGSSTPPTNAGSYAIVANISDAIYGGSTSGTLVVSKAAATITLSGLEQSYDGTPKQASATTSPSGLAVDLIYDGSATPPTAHGSYAVVATLSDTNHTATPQNGTLVIRGQAASEWRTQNFTQEQITAGLAANDADADGDGVKNLAEYALGTNPNSSASGPTAPVRDANGLTLTFTRPKGLPGVVYGAESSSNMSTWTPLTLEVINDGPVQTIRVRDPLSTGDISRRYIRLLFTTPP